MTTWTCRYIRFDEIPAYKARKWRIKRLLGTHGIYSALAIKKVRNGKAKTNKT